jgi:hypothetical protein
MMPQYMPATTRDTGPFGTPWWATALVCFLWVISPLDPIPEVPLGCIGLVDDLGVGAFGMYSAARAVRVMVRGPVQTHVPVAPEPPRTVALEPVPASRAAVGRMIDVSTAGTRSAMSAHEVSAVFVVQVVDDEGIEQRIEVEARDAEHARALVASLGADGRIVKVWLKRILNTQGGFYPETC